MPLENRNLETGTVLRARYKGKERTCEVVQTADGLRYRLDDGSEHKSPSSAGKAAMDGVACNGWRFWSLAGEVKPRVKAAPKKSARAKAAKQGKAKGKKPAKAHSTRSRAPYACGVCGAEFPTQKSAVEHATTHTA